MIIFTPFCILAIGSYGKIGLFYQGEATDCYLSHAPK